MGSIPTIPIKPYPKNYPALEHLPASVHRGFAREATACAADLQQAAAIALHLFIVFHPGDYVFQDALRVWVAWRDDAVVHPFSVSARGDHACPPKVGQVARDFGLALFKDLNEEAHAHFVIAHHVEYPEPRPVRESHEEALDIECLCFSHAGSILALLNIFVLTYVFGRVYPVFTFA